MWCYGPDVHLLSWRRIEMHFELAISIAVRIFVYVKLHILDHARRNSVVFNAAGYSRAGPDSTGL